MLKRGDSSKNLDSDQNKWPIWEQRATTLKKKKVDARRAIEGQTTEKTTRSPEIQGSRKESSVDIKKGKRSTA